MSTTHELTSSASLLAAVAPTRTLQVETIASTTAFDALEPEWRALVRASSAGGPFVGWDWLHAWWTHLGGERTLSLLVIRDEGRLVGLAPFAIAPGLFAKYELLGTGDAGSDYLDVIIRRGYELPVLTALARHAHRERLPLTLERVANDDASAVALAAQLRADGWTLLEKPLDACPVIALEGQTWASYLSSLGSSHRTNVRRRMRALESRFTVDFRAVDNDADRAVVLDALIELHTRRFEARGGTTAFHTPALRAFHHDASRRLLARGELRLFALRLDGRLVAAIYCVAWRDRYYFYQQGHDADYLSHSIGLVALALAIRAAIDERAAAFDLLSGHEAYKFLWARGARGLTRLDLFPPHLLGTLQRRTVETNRAVRSFAKRVLRRTHDAH